MSSFFCLMAAVLMGVGLAGAFPGERVARAQGADNGYVDVGLILEVRDHASTNKNHRLHVTVVNHGDRTAYDVEVVVNIVHPAKVLPEGSSYFLELAYYDNVGGLLNWDVPVGVFSQGDDRYSMKWSIPELGELQRETLEVAVIHESLTRDVAFDNKFAVHGFHGKVVTSSFESTIHGGNNTARVWSYTNATNNVNYQQAGGIIQSPCQWTTPTRHRGTPSISPS